MSLDKSKLIAMCNGNEVEITYADGEVGKAFVTRVGDESGLETYVDFSDLSDVQVVHEDHIEYYGKPHLIREGNTPLQIVGHDVYNDQVSYVDVRVHPGINNRPA